MVAATIKKQGVVPDQTAKSENGYKEKVYCDGEEQSGGAPEGANRVLTREIKPMQDKAWEGSGLFGSGSRLAKDGQELNGLDPA